MKKILFLISALIFLGCTEKKESLKVVNPNDVNLVDKGVVIPRNSLNVKNSRLPVLYDLDNKLVPIQLNDLTGDKEWDELVFQVTLSAKSEAVFTLDWVDPDNFPVFPRKTQVYLGFSETRNNVFVSVDELTRIEGHEPQKPPYSYQYEGPGWESNLVAFRSYFDTRNGKDIFGKSAEEMVTHEIGLGQNYHEQQPWGMDVLKVGTSLGAGALAILKKDSLIRLGATNYAAFKKVAEGPVQSVFSLTYRGWDVLGTEYELTELITIWANKRWYNSQVVLSPTTQDTLITGIVNLKEATVESFSHSGYDVLLTHGVQSENADALGMGLLVKSESAVEFSKAPTAGSGVTNTELAKVKSENGKYSFYFYAGWEVENEKFSELAFFRSELSQLSEELSSELKIIYQ